MLPTCSPFLVPSEASLAIRGNKFLNRGLQFKDLKLCVSCFFMPPRLFYTTYLKIILPQLFFYTKEEHNQFWNNK